MSKISCPFSGWTVLAARFVVLLVALWLYGGAFGQNLVPQGGSATFRYTGSFTGEGPYEYSWIIDGPSGSAVANSKQTNGWSVSFSGTNFTVGAPNAAIIENGYEVVYYGPFYFANFDVVAPGAPPAPTGLTATLANGQVNLTWSWTGSGSPSYNIYRCVITPVSFSPPAYGSSALKTFSDTAPAAGIWNSYTVTAVVDGVESNDSNVQTNAAQYQLEYAQLTFTSLSALEVLSG